MKIIQSNYTTICKCRCRFEFSDSERRVSIDGFGVRRYYIFCPNCFKKINLGRGQ